MRVTANIATHMKRREVLPKTLNSIKGQVDLVRVYCNDYRDEDLERLFPEVQFNYGDDLTDRGKFYGIKKGEVALTCDDDLLYPPDYAERIIQGLEKYPGSVVSFHGRKLQGKGKNYYFGHKQYHCQRTVEGDHLIDVPGSGVAGFNTDDFVPDVLQYPEDCMADVLLALEAAKKGVSVVCLEHDMFWIRSLWDSSKGSIYHEHRNDCARQGEICDLIYDLKY